MNARLVSNRGSKIHLAFPVERPRVTIGRDDDNMIQLPHAMISKHHGVIVRTRDGWAIEDLHSKNGVIVNGNRAARAELKNGDSVKIGPYDFHFETKVPSEDWVPSHIIDLSTKVHEPTILQTKPPGKA